MKKRMQKLLATVLAGTMILSMGTMVMAEETANTEVSGKITVGLWPSNDVAIKAALPGFQEAYPNIEVELIVNDAVSYNQSLGASLAAGAGAPDVALIEGGYMPQYRDSLALTNLLEEPYNAAQYEDQFVEMKWNAAFSVDGTRMVGIPWDMGPNCMFYRTDVFAEVGLPTEPEEVAEYMSTWEGVLDVARKVSIPGQRWFCANGSYLYQSYFGNNDFFDEQLNLQLDREGDIECLETIITMREEELDMNTDQWSTEACTAYETGALATFPIACWAAGSLKGDVAPGAAGKWGVTTLPGGLPSSNQGGSFFTIPEQCENKEAAWTFIQYMLCNADTQNLFAVEAGTFPAYLPAFEDEEIYAATDAYFSDQNVMGLWADIASNIKPVFNTVMDTTAAGCIYSSVNAGIEEGLDPQGIKDRLAADIEAASAEAKNQQIQIMKDAGIWEE